MPELWIRWEPVNNLASKYYIKSIFSGISGFKITLLTSDNFGAPLKVVFKGGVDSYLWTDESFRLKKMHELSETQGSSFYGKWTFFKVENSDYLNWIDKQSYGISQARSLIHFSFVTEDSILDVISASEPEVIFKKK